MSSPRLCCIASKMCCIAYLPTQVKGGLWLDFCEIVCDLWGNMTGLKVAYTSPDGPLTMQEHSRVGLFKRQLR